MWHSDQEAFSWYMVKLDKAVFIKTIFFLERWSGSTKAGTLRSQGAQFLVGFQSDPTKMLENPACPEIVGTTLSGISDTGYFECGLWGDVLVVRDKNPDVYFQIMELRAYAWDHLSSKADWRKVRSSCGPGHCRDLLTRQGGFVVPLERFLIKRPLNLTLNNTTPNTGYMAANCNKNNYCVYDLPSTS